MYAQTETKNIFTKPQNTKQKKQPKTNTINTLNYLKQQENNIWHIKITFQQLKLKTFCKTNRTTTGLYKDKILSGNDHKVVKLGQVPYTSGTFTFTVGATFPSTWQAVSTLLLCVFFFSFFFFLFLSKKFFVWEKFSNIHLVFFGCCAIKQFQMIIKFNNFIIIIDGFQISKRWHRLYCVDRVANVSCFFFGCQARCIHLFKSILCLKIVIFIIKIRISSF
jgi:hypothetical protein